MYSGKTSHIKYKYRLYTYHMKVITSKIIVFIIPMDNKHNGLICNVFHVVNI